MIVGRDRFEEVYATIRQAACAGGAQTVLVLVAPDCDALCGAHILARLLRDDNVPHKTQPVAGYDDVKAALADVGSTEVRTVILLNCGATANLPQLIGDAAATVFVVDSHRPVHLRNRHSGGRVVVLDAEAPDAADDAPSDGEDLDDDFLASDVDSDDASSDSDEEEVEDEADGAGADPDAPPAPPGAKRARSRRERREAKRARQDAAAQRRTRVRAYYDGSFDGPPTSALLFALTEAVSRAEPTELWLAALGLAGARASWRLDDDAYDDFSDYFAAQLRHVEARRARLGEAAPVPGEGFQAPPGTVTHEKEELRFMLHRHWSLFDAMYYSNYIAARLSVWKHDGKRRLQELLAKVGLSLETCRQTYSYLSRDEREGLVKNLREQGPAYDLDEPFTSTFHRVAASGAVVSAHDVASAVDALLEGHFVEDSAAALARAARATAGRDESSVAERGRQQFLAGFWRAYDAALGDDAALLKRGVAAAGQLQRGVVDQAVSMVEKREVATLRHFRYAYVTAACGDVFAKPLALRKLALFLVGVHRANGKWADAKAKPLVLLAEKSSTFLVVGVDAREGAAKNRLAAAFRLACEHIKVDAKQDLFDSAVVELAHDDVQRFVESLHYIMTHSG